MPFDATDPRSGLAAPPRSDAIPSTGHGFAPARVISFADHPPELSAAGSRTWRVRTQNFALAYSEAVAGDRFIRENDELEYLAVLPDPTTEAVIETADTSMSLIGPALAVIPPGLSTVRAISAGTVIRVFTSAISDMADGSLTSDFYAAAPPYVTLAQPSLPPKRLACYQLSDYPPHPSRFGHIFRSQNLMLNFVPDRIGPRDVTKLSPHSHADFEQCSVQLQGRFIHHVRTPWTPDSTTWRSDQHLELAGPGVVIFPPPIVHTSQAVGDGLNRLLDVFGPPRDDFLAKSGWVLNAAEYPPSMSDG